MSYMHVFIKRMRDIELLLLLLFSVGFFESDFHSFSHSERHIVWFISFAFLEKFFKKSLKNCLYHIQKKSGT